MGKLASTAKAVDSIAAKAAELVRLGYPESTARKIASGELPMDQASRMARAREQGFDVDQTVYHGSGNSQSIANDGFQPSLTGQGNDQIGSGFYFTTDPYEASGYTSSITQRAGPDATKLGGDGSPGVVQANLAVNNPMRVDGSSLRDVDVDLTPDQVSEILRYSEQARDIESTPLWNFMDISGEDAVEDWMLDGVANQYQGNSLLSLEGDWFDGESQNFRKALNETLGYDGVIQDFGEKQHTVAWFPEQVRSQNAAFDPANIGSSNILGNATPEMLAATATTAAAATFLQTREQKQGKWQSLRDDLKRSVGQAGQAANFALTALEKPWQGLLGASRVAGGLASGESFNDAMFAGANQVRQPVDQTADQLGGAVVDYTGSPALGTAVNVGVNLGGPI